MKLLTILLLCGSCHAFNVIPGFKLVQTVHYRCEPRLADSFLREFAQWNSVLDNRFSLIQESDASAAVDLNVSYSDNIAPDWGWGGFGIIMISTEMKQFELSMLMDSVMLHEIGHCLGLSHSADIGAIMFPSAKAMATLGTDDVDGVRSIYGLPATDWASFQLNVAGVGRTKICYTSGYVATWDFGDGSVSITGQKVKHRFHAKGTYAITATYLGVSRSVSIEIGHPKRARK